MYSRLWTVRQTSVVRGMLIFKKNLFIRHVLNFLTRLKKVVNLPPFVLFDFRSRPSLLPLPHLKIALMKCSCSLWIILQQFLCHVWEVPCMRAWRWEMSTESSPRPSPGARSYVSRLRSDSLTDSQHSHQAYSGSHRLSAWCWSCLYMPLTHKAVSEVLWRG